tara:strand:- start:118 stop:447 length:330 start_codon:yes stop_codon:yes gene_type:complete
MQTIINWFITPINGNLCGDIVSKYLKMPDGKLEINKDNTYTYVHDKKIINIKYVDKLLSIECSNNQNFLIDPLKLDKYFNNKFLENQKKWILNYGVSKENLNLIKFSKK